MNLLLINLKFMAMVKFVSNIGFKYSLISAISVLTLSSELMAEGNQSVITNQYKVKEIVVDGYSKEVELSDVEDALDVRRASMFKFWSDKKPYINEKLIPSLSEVLKRYYDSLGYYDAKFNIIDNNETVKVSIEQGIPVEVNSIDIVGNYNIDELITSKKKEIFQSKKFVDDKQNIISKLLLDGYCSYDLDTKAYVDLDKHIVDLIYKINKGDVCTFGETNIVGNEDIDKKVILSRVEARQGSRFSTKKAKETYQRLEDLDTFDSVVVNVDRKIYNVVPVDLTLKLVENPYYFTGGLGYDSYTGARIQAQLTKKNFLGDAQKLILTSRYSQKEQLLNADFFRPALFSSGKYYIDFGMHGGYSNLEFIGFMEEKEYVKGYIGYELNNLFLRAGIALENINISSIYTIPSIQDGNYVLLYPYFEAILDKRDDKLNPKNGYYLACNFEYGIPYNQTASDFTKILLEARGIYSVGNYTFASVFKAGTIEEITGYLPESKLFFGGGSFGNRAYGYNELGVIASPTSYLVSGALSYANLSLEVDYRINEDYALAIFTDNTMLTAKNYDFNGDIIHSAGIGLRYITPVGPFKIDIGANINDISQFGVQFQLGQSF